MVTAARHLILQPRTHWWEAGGVFNPGAVLWRGQTHLLYRAVGKDHISRFGLAISADGEVFERFDQPVLESSDHSPFERLGIEDPRLTVIDNTVYVAYTAASVYPFNARNRPTPPVLTETPWRLRSMLARTKDFRRFELMGAIVADLDTKDVVLFPEKINGQYWILHRLTPAIYLSSNRQLTNFSGGLEIAAPKEKWEQQKIGAACPPIKTDQGWLVLYHGVDTRNQYAIGTILLALHNPAQVLGRSSQPVLVPRVSWEKEGHDRNVIFVTGAVVRGEMVWLYYGGADKVCGLVKLPLATLLRSCQSKP